MAAYSNEIMNLVVADQRLNNSFDASENILEDVILEKVVKHVWEKELVSKHQVPYMVKWANQQGPTLMAADLERDKKVDDELITPRGGFGPDGVNIQSFP